MRDEGQAIVLAVIVLAIAAAATSGLREAQDRLVDGVRAERAGEAAVQAAGAVVADRLVLGREPDELVSDPQTLLAAGDAAAEAAAANGSAPPTGLRAFRSAGGLVVELTLSGRRQRAEVPWPCCRR